MLNALLSRRRGGEPAPAAKRQRRADVLEDLGGGLGGSSASRGGLLGGGLRLPVGGRSAAAVRAPAGVVASAGAAEAKGEGGEAAGATAALEAERSEAKELLAQAAQGEGGEAAGATAALEAERSEAKDKSQSAEDASPVSGERRAEALLASAANVQDDVAGDGSTGAGKQKGDAAPALIADAEDLQGWRAQFAKAKDCWDVGDDGMRSLFWHSKTGCCFEWDQCAGMLYQYGEDATSLVPKQLPIWSTACPERHNWIWEQLPLPPTDPAAEEPDLPAEEEQPAERGDLADAASESAGNSPLALGVAPGPTAAPPGAKASEGPPASSDAAASEAQIDAPGMSATPFDVEAPGGKSAASEGHRLHEGAVGSAADASVSASAAACMPPPVGLPKKRKSASPSSAGASSSGGEPSSKKSEVSEETDIFGGVDLLDDVDEDEPSGDIHKSLPVGPLAEGAEVVALPAAPAEPAKPQACDLDLDIFGAPYEAAEIVP